MEGKNSHLFAKITGILSVGAMMTPESGTDASWDGRTHFLTEAAGPGEAWKLPKAAEGVQRGLCSLYQELSPVVDGAASGPSSVGRVWTACHSGPCRAVDRHPARDRWGQASRSPSVLPPSSAPPPHGQARNVRSQQQARDCRRLHSTISVTVTLGIR